MRSKNLKLSICIPTYNREKYLDAILDSLVRQVAALPNPDVVEILVSNNASPDNSVSVCEKYANSIRYWRNDENIGPDANFLKLFGEAVGEFIWLPGDDDAVRDDTLQYILNTLKAQAVDYLYLKTAGEVSKDAGIRGVERFSNVNLLRRVNIFTTFMTSQVIRASLIQPKLQAAHLQLGGYMAYYWLFLEALFSSQDVFVSEEREVFPEGENTGGYRFYNVWAIGVFDVLRNSSFANVPGIFSYMKYRMFFSLILPVTYRLRSGGSGFRFQSEDPAISLRKYFGRGIYHLISLSYLRMPLSLLAPLRHSIRVLVRLVRMVKRDIV